MLVAPPPLSTNVMVPARAPVVDGVKLTVMTQVAFTATEAQVLDWPKSAEPVVTLRPENTRALVPVLVTVTDCVVAVDATCCAANVRLDVDSDAEPWTPVAAKAAVTVPAPVTNDKVPLRAVVVEGVN